VIKSLKERFGYVDVVMVGDGATDMQVGEEGREGGIGRGPRVEG